MVVMYRVGESRVLDIGAGPPTGVCKIIAQRATV